MAFLDKANADPSAGVAKKQSRSQQARLKTVDREEDIPVRLREVTKDAFYVSDADEPFEPVCLRLMDGEDTLPDEGAFLRGPPLGYSLLGSYLLIWGGSWVCEAGAASESRGGGGGDYGRSALGCAWPV